MHSWLVGARAELPDPSSDKFTAMEPHRRAYLEGRIRSSEMVQQGETLESRAEPLSTQELQSCRRFGA
jgi:hypothetical protein